MAGSTLIPQGNNERIAWSLNFETEFTAELAELLGFSVDERKSLLDDSAEMRFDILLAQAAGAFSKSVTAFKNAKLGGAGENQLTPQIPVFVPPTAPITLVDDGIIERLSKAMNRAKLSAGYTKAIGEQLMIEGAENDSGGNNDDAKPTGEATPLTGSLIRIDWKKGKFDGVFIESRRGDETEWENLDFDMRSPYEDARPPLAAGKPEERRYRLRYFIDNQPVGEWSDVIVVYTIP